MDCDEVLRLARWRLRRLTRSATALAIVSFFEKPWHWNDERETMLGNKFRCATCDALTDVTNEELAERVEEGVDCYCADCAAELAAEAKAQMAADIAEARELHDRREP